MLGNEWNRIRSFNSDENGFTPIIQRTDPSRPLNNQDSTPQDNTMGNIRGKPLRPFSYLG